MVDNRNDPQYKLRMTQALKDKIQASARANNRTLNAEINLRLESSYQHLQMTLFGDLVPVVSGEIPVVSDRLLMRASSLELNATEYSETLEDLSEILKAQLKAVNQTSAALASLSTTEIYPDDDFSRKLDL